MIMITIIQKQIKLPLFTVVCSIFAVLKLTETKFFLSNSGSLLIKVFSSNKITVTSLGKKCSISLRKPGFVQMMVSTILLKTKHNLSLVVFYFCYFCRVPFIFFAKWEYADVVFISIYFKKKIVTMILWNFGILFDFLFILFVYCIL